MQFMKSLRDPIRRGEITTTVRLWRSSRVKIGGRYSLPPGHVVVARIFEVGLALMMFARRSGTA